jgi:general secretion pathway protein G
MTPHHECGGLVARFRQKENLMRTPHTLELALASTSAARRRRPRAMSLLEIMVVITLIGLVTATIGVAVINQLGKGQADAARNQAYEIAKSLDIYKLQNGSYPTTAQGLGVLKNPQKGKPIMDDVPKDPWGNEYIYVTPGQKNPTKFDVRSKGNDGIEGNEDDVGNWPE